MVNAMLAEYLTLVVVSPVTVFASRPTVEAAPASLEGHVFHCGSLQGTNYVQAFSKADDRNYPRWRADGSKCPLGPGAATSLARKHLRRRFPTVADWGVSGIRLFRWGDDIWVYWVVFTSPVTVSFDDLLNGKGPPALNIVVGMNGSVPEIVTEKSWAQDTGDELPRSPAETDGAGQMPEGR